MGLLVLILLLVLVAGAWPRWSYSRDWGYRPSSGAGLVLGIAVILLLLGYFPLRF